MRITPRDQMAGIPAIRVRNALERNGDRPITHLVLRARLKITHDQAAALMRVLQRQKLIAADKVQDGQAHFELTRKGKEFCVARATRPLRPSSCNKIVHDFLERVEQANRDPAFIYRVKRAALYGGMATGLQRIRQIDLALELERKESDEARFAELWQVAMDAATEIHPYISPAELIRWPADQLLKFLKSRHWSLAFRSLNDEILAQPDTRVIYVWHDDAAGQKRLFDTNGYFPTK